MESKTIFSSHKYTEEEMTYLFIAIESIDIDKIKNDLIKLTNTNENKIIIAKAHTETSKLRQFNMISDLYIWTCKYWHGTYYENLTYIRIENEANSLFLFFLKYNKEIRLCIESKNAEITKNEDYELLKKTSQNSIHNFDKQRITAIMPGLSRLEKKKWKLLISNGNPYPNQKDTFTK
jgi:hypothetical protein